MSTIPLSDRPSLIQSGLNFSAFGYFTRPISSSDLVGCKDSDASAWLKLEQTIDSLKSGDFSVVQELLQACRASDDWRFKTVATQVLGHVGSVDCFRDMRSELDRLALRTMETIDVETREIVLLYCDAFEAWGRLDVVPVLMHLYLSLRLKKTAEISMLPLLMDRLLIGGKSSMIGLDPPDDMLEDYLNLVMNEYEAVVQRLGSDKILVLRGEPQSVRDLAQRMHHLVSKYPAGELRRLRERFEPATGIDCSAVFSEPTVSPLQAAALAGEFLDSGAADRYESGRRYFFGHAVPD